MKQRILLAITVLAILFATAVAQGQTNQPAQGAGRRGMAMNGQRQAGEITAINADSWTVRTESGSSVTVNLTSDTRYMKDGEAAKADDFKIGDHIMVIGPSTGENAISARAVASISGGGGMGRGAARMTQMPEGLGTKFIAGEVKAIEGTKLTIARPDGQNQVIEVDENTSFRKMRESITLPDIKVGDRVFGRGEMKDGTFLAAELNLGGPQMGIGPGAPPQQ